jgi:hypothetical protein
MSQPLTVRIKGEARPDATVTITEQDAASIVVRARRLSDETAGVLEAGMLGAHSPEIVSPLDADVLVKAIDDVLAGGGGRDQRSLERLRDALVAEFGASDVTESSD